MNEQPPGPEQPSRVIDCALAEFSALRGELDEIGRGQRTVMSLNISANTAVAAFVLSQRVAPQLLLVIPYLSVALGMLYQTYANHARYMGDYINEHLRPIIVEKAGDNRLFGWEQHMRTRLYQDSASRLPMRAAFTLIVPMIPAVGLIWSIPYLHPAWYWLAWCGGLTLFALQIVSWIKQSWDFVWI
ncbi:hypothetical protein ACQP1G_29100 [Nocardia sp. CA-107356]|uniref:hypothetical protein n=1 Tax=Nocardia sp. CA-107356 TaxID=3239972 RepID=UPI003D8AA196